MKGKVFGMLAVVLVLSLGLAGTVQAGELATEPADELEAGGRLWARGIGYAGIRGSGAVDLSVRGVGTVVVKGAEVVRAEGRGRRWDLPGGGTVFVGWRGTIHLAGHDLHVRMWGSVVEFTARGTGTGFLKGRGVYRIDGQVGHWTREGVRLD